MKKPTIKIVGVVSETGEPTGWCFDCHGSSIPAFSITESGEVLYGGYTVDELRVIAASHRGAHKPKP